MEMGQVHTGLGNAVVLTLLIFSTECPGPVAMFKPKKRRKKKERKGVRRTRKRKSVNSHYGAHKPFVPQAQPLSTAQVAGSPFSALVLFAQNC